MGGIKDSTKTRVIPLMNHIGKDIKMINDLFSLISKVRPIAENDSDIKIFFDDKEKKLCPKQELLEWYVTNYDKLIKVKNFGSSNKDTQDNRREILNGSKEKIEEALSLIRQNPTATKKWYIFEGYSQPDIYIETSSAIYIGEAKRTERNLTTSTQWLDPRDQLIRHADSVIDGDKDVFFFFLIDEEKESIYDLARYEDDFDYYKASLPHRSDKEDSIKKIMKSYCGYTTWQKISEKFGITFPDTIN